MDYVLLIATFVAGMAASLGFGLALRFRATPPPREVPELPDPEPPFFSPENLHNLGERPPTLQVPEPLIEARHVAAAYKKQHWSEVDALWAGGKPPHFPAKGTLKK